MPQGAADAALWFIYGVRVVTAGLYDIRMFLDDAIGFNSSPPPHVGSLASFFASHRLHRRILSPPKASIGTTVVDFWGNTISADGVRPNTDNVATLNEIPMYIDLKQLRSLLDGFSFYR